jgi:hypothetical protein
MLNNFLHLQTLTDNQRANLARSQALWKYYNGDFKTWLQPKLLPNGNMIDDNVKIKLARKIVTKGNYFLFGKGLNWQIDQKTATTAETVLQKVWGNQETQNTLLSELGINGAVTGTFYMQIVSRESGLSVKNLNPMWIFPTLDPSNDEAIQYDMRFSIQEDIFRILHTRKDSGLWEYTKEQYTRSKWIIVQPTKEWPFEWPFIVSGKNLPNPNSFYGMSDLEDVDLNDSINLVASNLNRIIRIFAHPVIWGYGFGSSAMNVDSSKVITSTAENAKLEALELARDLSSPQEYLKFLRTMLSDITAVPESDPDRLAIGAQSGFALEVLFNDLLLKTSLKRSFYGKALIELNRRLLELSGFGPDNQTTLHWPNPLPTDKISETQSDTFDLASGLVSKRTLSSKRGYDYDLEKEYMLEEKTNVGNLGEQLISAFRSGNS